MAAGIKAVVDIPVMVGGLLDDAALAAVVEQTLAEIGPVTPQMAGRVVGAVMKKVAASGASADAGKVKTLVESKMGA